MPVPSRVSALQLNDMALTVYGLKNAMTGEYANAATVTATLYDSSGNAVSAFTSISMGYIPGTNGNYRGTISQTFNPNVGTEYILKIDGVQWGSDFHIEIPCSVKVRRS